MSLDHPLLLLFAIPATAAALAFWWRGYDNLGRIRRRLALGIRLLLLCAIVLALAGLALELPQGRQANVVIADVSASDVRGESAMQQFIRTAARERPSQDRLGVVAVGRNAQVESPVGTSNSFSGFQTGIDPNYTDLASGLLLGNAIMPAGYEHRLTLITDGWQNSGDALSVARLVHSLGIRVDVMPVHSPSGPEVRVQAVNVPSTLRTRERFSVGVTLDSNISTGVQVNLYRDHSLVATRAKRVQPGQSRLGFAQPALKSGFHSFQVQITPKLDTQAQNNVGSGFAIVSGPAKVLVISPTRAEAGNVLRSLHSTGIKAQWSSPGTVSPFLSALQKFAAIVLINTPADSLTYGFNDAIVPFVRDLGHGLVVLGGNESYGVGNYSGTGLEKALPVNMNLPKRKDLPSAAVVLVIESLEADVQINISKQAGKGVVSLLNPADWVAVNDAYGSGHFAVKLQHVTDKRRIDNRIDSMSPGDPMSYVPDLEASYRALKRVPAKVKHIILLGDGDAYSSHYESVVKQIHAAGITISTVSTNGEGWHDFKTMRNIAKWGGGRYYNGNNPNAIPKIFVREARSVARSGIVTGKFFPQELSSNPMLRDLRSSAPLTGYVATTPKPTGEIILASKKLDPVLAAWQFGLGRSVAWTSDANGAWTEAWLQAHGANRFWADLVSWTLPAHQNGKLFVSSSVSAGEGHVSVRTPGLLGLNPRVTAHVLSPSGHGMNVRLQPTAPGKFDASFSAKDQGAYFITVQASGRGHAEAGRASLDAPYSAEFLTAGTNTAFIRSLAKAGGGSVVRGPASTWAPDLAPVNARTPLNEWLWLLALLLLPVDIAVRRLVLSRSDMDAIRQAIKLPARRAPEHTSVSLPLETLRRSRGAMSPQVGPLAGAASMSSSVDLSSSPGEDNGPRLESSLVTNKSKPVDKSSAAAATSLRVQPLPTAAKLLASKRRRS